MVVVVVVLKPAACGCENDENAQAWEQVVIF